MRLTLQLLLDTSDLSVLSLQLGTFPLIRYQLTHLLLSELLHQLMLKTYFIAFNSSVTFSTVSSYFLTPHVTQTLKPLYYYYYYFDSLPPQLQWCGLSTWPTQTGQRGTQQKQLRLNRRPNRVSGVCVYNWAGFNLWPDGYLSHCEVVV